MTTQKIDSLSIYASPVLAGFIDGITSQHDLVLRVQMDDKYKTTSIVSTQTKVIRDGINEYFVQHTRDIELLSSVIYWQKRTIDYQALNMAFMMDSLSEEDFEEEAEKFVVRQHEVQPELIANFIERLDLLTGLKLDTSDYADYFQCSQNNVMDGLKMLDAPHFVAMLPSLEKTR